MFAPGHILYKDPDGIVHQGWMQKAGKINSWAYKRRYFRLVANPAQLWYYSSESVVKPRGGISLLSSSGDTSVTVDGDIVNLPTYVIVRRIKGAVS
eukprot:1395031-Amorphochlora_amoeboformis.AAC.3